MKSSFPKRVKRQSKKYSCNGNAKLGDHDLEKSSSLICAHVHIYSYVKSSFLKDNNQTWHWHCKPFFGIALNAFWISLLIRYFAAKVHAHTHRYTGVCKH